MWWDTLQRGCVKLPFLQLMHVSDVFSMGIVLLEMIRRCTDGKYTIPWYSDFGVLPEADFVILMDVGKGLRPTLNGVPLNAPSPNSVPIPLAQLYQDCVAQDKEDRPTSKQILSRQYIFFPYLLIQ